MKPSPLRLAAVVVGMSVTANAAESRPAPESPAAKLSVLWTFPLKSHSFGGGAAADVNEDGVLDIAFGTYFGDASVHVLSGGDGHELWSYHDPDATRDDCYDASCRFADVDGSGHLSLVIPCSSASRVICLDAPKGTVRWNTFLGGGECIDTPPWIGDCDGDGHVEIVVGTFKSNLFVLDGRDGKIKRELHVPGPGAVQSCPVVMDLDGDGTADFVAGLFAKNRGGLFALNGKDGAPIWSIELNQPVYHGPAIGRPRSDGKEYLAFGAYDGRIRLVKPESGEVLWSVESRNRYIMAPIATAPEHRDGKPDRMFFTGDEYGTVNGEGEIDGTDPVSAKPLDTCSRGASVADLDDDGEFDWAFFTSRGVFKAVSGRKVINVFDAGTLLGEGKSASDNSHSPVLADFSGDGRLDAFFVVGGGGELNPDKTRKPRYGVAVCLTGFNGVASATNGWYMMRHDPHNTGNVATALDPVLLRHITVKGK